VRDSVGILSGERKLRINSLPPLLEEHDSGRTAHRPERGATYGHGQRWNGQNVFLAQMQWGATGRQDLECGAVDQQRGDQAANRGQEVLTVVKEEQQLRLLEMSDDNAGRVTTSDWRYAQCGGKGCRQNLRVTHRGKVNEDHTPGKVVAGLRRNRKRQLGLAHTTRACQGQQGSGVIEEQRARHRALGFPSNQARAQEREEWVRQRPVHSPHDAKTVS
jgi:hypothetical protein